MSRHTKIKLYDVNSGDLIDESKESVQPADFRKFDKYAWLKGYRHLPANNTVSEWNIKFTQDVWLWGGSYIAKNVNPGDYLEFEIVDIDNIVGFGAGAVLNRYVETEYVAEGDRFDMRSEDGAYIMQGLYLRTRYVSTGNTNPQLITRFYLRRY